jgi:hypothetical protein
MGIAALLGGVLYLSGAEWWMALLLTGIVAGFFVWAPRSGRYVVDPQAGAFAMRRDERTGAITDKAARNGFLVVMLGLAAMVLYFGSWRGMPVPTGIVNWMLIIGMGTYFVSDVALRRATEERDEQMDHQTDT